jgi:hypothetical protein
MRSVHSVIDKDTWDVIEQLKEAGEGILICPIGGTLNYNL